MSEIVITIVVPATPSEPAHTVLYRFEYETFEQANQAVARASEGALDGGRMINNWLAASATRAIHDRADESTNE